MSTTALQSTGRVTEQVVAQVTLGSDSQWLIFHAFHHHTIIIIIMYGKNLFKTPKQSRVSELVSCIVVLTPHSIVIINLQRNEKKTKDSTVTVQ